MRLLPAGMHAYNLIIEHMLTRGPFFVECTWRIRVRQTCLLGNSQSLGAVLTTATHPTTMHE
jgi:hypothetical protein